MDDVTFGRNGHDAGKGWQPSASAIKYMRDRGWVWCLWIGVIVVNENENGAYNTALTGATAVRRWIRD